MPGHEPIVREHRGEPRESGEPGIRREEEDDGGRDLHEVVERGAGADHCSRDHAVHRFDLALVRLYANPGGQIGDAEENGREDRANQDERDHRVPCLGPPKARHSIRDGLAPGQAHRSRRECAQDEQDRERRGPLRREGVGWRHRRRDVAGDDAEQAEREEPVHREHVRVRRPGEKKSGFAYAAEVSDRENRDEHDPDDHAVFMELGDEARDRGDACRRRYGDREHVVDEQGRRSHQPGDDTVVLARDEVAPAAVRVRADHPRLGEDDDREDEHDSECDRQRERERRPASNRENAHRLLGRISGRGHVVRSQDRKPRGDPHALLGLGIAVEALADKKTEGRVEAAADPAAPLHGLLGGDVAAAMSPYAAAGRPHDPDVAVAEVASGLGDALLERGRLGSFLLLVAQCRWSSWPSSMWYGTSITMVFGRKRRLALRRSAVWLWRSHSHQLCGTNEASTTVIGLSESRSAIRSMYLSTGGTSERYGDSMISRGTWPAHASHRLRNSLALSSLVATWTALTAGEMERAKAIAWALERSRRPTGTITTGARIGGAGSSRRSITSASWTSM